MSGFSGGGLLEQPGIKSQDRSITFPDLEGRTRTKKSPIYIHMYPAINSMVFLQGASSVLFYIICLFSPFAC